MKIIKAIVNIYNKIEEYFLVINLVAMVAVIFMQVIMRYVFNNSLTWSEELARYLFIWQVLLAASVATRKNIQIRIEMFSQKIKSLKGKQALELLVNFLIMGLYITFFISGMASFESIADKDVVSIAMRMPMTLVFFAIPFSSAIIVLRMLCRIIYDIIHFGQEKPLKEGSGEELITQ